ncbi:MAG: hydrogenase formation protein HypD [Spirochaetales bacterium]|nr:hydrogenase formation protein HypD [Spirochaetales bacterium]
MIRYIDEFRQAKAARYIARSIADRMAGINNEVPIRLMEVCGGHTNAIFKFGIRNLLPESIALLSGPGCPVCVTPNRFIDTAIELGRRPDFIITTFGDMIRVPGSRSSLLEERASGSDIRICLSPTEALSIAEDNPGKNTVFLGIGFETTAPSVAVSIIEARERGIAGFSVLSALKTMPEALYALLSSDDLNIDGLICPGHVSSITGTAIYRPIAETFGIPCVVSGFEPPDILSTIDMIVAQIAEGRHDVENQYTRAVRPEGNKRAQDVMRAVFTPCDSRWRGIGTIPGSGLAVSEEYREFDAEFLFSLELPEEREVPGCICGHIMRGAKTPLECPLFSTACTPQDPKGACMVSAEGTCSAYYRYGNR